MYYTIRLSGTFACLDDNYDDKFKTNCMRIYNSRCNTHYREITQKEEEEVLQILLGPRTFKGIMFLTLRERQKGPCRSNCMSEPIGRTMYEMRWIRTHPSILRVAYTTPYIVQSDWRCCSMYYGDVSHGLQRVMDRTKSGTFARTIWLMGWEERQFAA